MEKTLVNARLQEVLGSISRAGHKSRRRLLGGGGEEDMPCR